MTGVDGAVLDTSPPIRVHDLCDRAISDCRRTCHARYIGSDDQWHRCTRPADHSGHCRAGDYS